MAIDPICKKTVDEKTAPSSVYKNKEYYFCSEECKKKFDELDKSVIRVRRSLKSKERISFGKLKREIIDPGICTLCGACVASCEVLSQWQQASQPSKDHAQPAACATQPVRPHNNHGIKPHRERARCLHCKEHASRGERTGRRRCDLHPATSMLYIRCKTRRTGYCTCS